MRKSDQLRKHLDQLTDQMGAMVMNNPEAADGKDEAYEALASQYSVAWVQLLQLMPRDELLKLVEDARHRRDSLERKAIDPQIGQIPDDPRPYIAYENLQIARYLSALAKLRKKGDQK